MRGLAHLYVFCKGADGEDLGAGAEALCVGKKNREGVF
jgi:hypothetical protein